MDLKRRLPALSRRGRAGERCMTGKLIFTRKTWYFLLLVAAAASMANGLAVLAGLDFSFLELCAFCASALAVLFLAAQKGAPAPEKRRYFAVFVLLLLSYATGGLLAYVCAALAWPVLLVTEQKRQKRGAQLERPLRLVCFAEAAHLALTLLAAYGGFASLRFFANLFWVLLAAARGWAALALYKTTPRES
jgi:hypothetical protein